MKTLHFIFLSYLISVSASLYSQDTSIANFLPVAVGNVWVYNWHEYQTIPPIDNSGIYVVKLTGSFVVNNKIYYNISRLGAGCSAGYEDIFNNNALSLDSVTGNVYAYTPGQGCSNTPDEKMIDSLRMKLNDHLSIYCNLGYITCFDTTTHDILGTMRQTKDIGTQGPDGGSSHLFAKGIGISSFGSSVPMHSCSYELKGCVINGIVYGDTGTIIGINKIGTEIPKSFSLYQNYPNPFNPVTKIKFDNPSVRDAYMHPLQIVVYDLLGKELITLVNQSLKRGTYEIDFDASNLPSGIYFYTLTADGFSESKRMVLLK